MATDLLRRLVAYLLARLPGTTIARVRSLPLIGPLIHAASHRLTPPGTTLWVAVESGSAAGLRFLLDPRYEGDFWQGTHESEVINRLPELLSVGAVVYDVGAHLGYFALTAARLVGASGRVYAFEADPGNAERLATHVEANNLDTVRIVPLAVWSKPGTVSFATDESHPIRSYGRVGATGVTRDVEATSLETFAVEAPRPDLIKIDVEGGELEVLVGARRLLAETPPIVICEVHLEAGAAADRLRLTTELLEGHGYRIEVLTPGSDPTHLLAVHKACVSFGSL